MKTILSFLLLFSTSVFAQTGSDLPAISQANHNDFFIPDMVCRKYHLEAGQQDDWMKAYNNISGNGAIQRVNDIRWQAKDKEQAMRWYNANTEMLSEKGEDITNQIPKPKGVDIWNVYVASKGTKEMMKSLGIAQNQYTFTFTVDRYIAKIFIATTEKFTLKDARLFASEGVLATIEAAGKNNY